MRAEVERDIAAGTVRLSRLLSATGQERYIGLLLAAVDRGTSATLAEALRSGGCLDPTRMAGADTGEVDPDGAALRIAQREFRRYFARGICARAIAAGFEFVEVYRARAQPQAPKMTDTLIGRRLHVGEVLDGLRGGNSLDGVLGLPSSGCSGLSVRPMHLAGPSVPSPVEPA